MKLNLDKQWYDRNIEAEENYEVVAGMEEKLYTAAQWQEARKEHRKNNPETGDYWWCDMLNPLFVVLEVLPNHVIVCDKIKPTDENHWTWDLSEPKLMTRDDFKKRIDKNISHLSDSKHNFVVDEFNMSK